MMADAAVTGFAVAVMHPQDPQDPITTVSQGAALRRWTRRTHGRWAQMFYAARLRRPQRNILAGSIKLAAIKGVPQWASRACSIVNSNVIELASPAVAFLPCPVELTLGEGINQKVQVGVFFSTRAGERGIMAVEGIAGVFISCRPTG
jgi:hypothetical protein